MAGVADFILLSILPGDGAAVMADYGAEVTTEVVIMAEVTVEVTTEIVLIVLRETGDHNVQAILEEVIILGQEEVPIMALV